MDAEPFVPTPEKMGAGGAASDGLTASKRNLFTVSALKDAGVQKVLRQQQENRCSEVENAGALAANFEQKGLGRKQKLIDPPVQKDLRGRRCSDGSVELQLMGHSELPFASPGCGSAENREDAGSLPAGKGPSKQQHDRDNAIDGTTPTAPAGRVSESIVLHTPLKAKRPDTDNVLFTPPPAPGFRRPSITSSPVTPLPDAVHDAPGRQIPKKPSARLKQLSMQLKEAGQDTQDTSDGATSSSVEATPEASAASSACDTPAPHPYVLLASGLPAEDLMADPKYRGMAALGCQHQYTDADRASFLRRRGFVARDLNSAFAA
ncbi:hypothetical protein KFL_003070090 [Klebsormidium nitens]|uniref:Uncharacterized protein n=1 Tax=Klebsormidium nitens TaxID=105231 RepID=A0A1Y1ICC2_KLENI|nr:hypothetical protein KFL_003070090 [Klebsormidium nitens]|eukprot:GAQ86721.1 hypothetical protein KFL_003070090 [Klebsormidium nitens]